MQNKVVLIFIESYVAGGSDKIARLLAENLPYKKIYLLVNKRFPVEILSDNLNRENIEIIQYSFVSPAELGTYALKFKKYKLLYMFLRIVNLFVRYPLIVFSMVYFYCLFKRLGINLYVSNNGGYPGGEYNRSSSIAASFVVTEKTFHIYHSIPLPYNRITILIEKLYDAILDKRVVFITDSEFCSKKLVERRNIKQVPVVIYNGINFLTKKNFYCSNQSLKLLQIGTLDSNKNQLFSLKLLSYLISRGHDVMLYIVGKESEEGYLSQLMHYTKQNKLENYVFFEGFQSETYRYYQECDILLLTSKIESFPTVILEAMSVGMPVITSHTGGVCEQVKIGENGFIIKQDDIDEFLNKIIFFSENREKIQEFGEASHILFMQKFTIDKMICGYMALLNESQKNG